MSWEQRNADFCNAQTDAQMAYIEAEREVDRLQTENAKLREQMERLVTLLRVDCDIDASWDGLRRFWSIGLTEDGCLMRDRACKAEAENAKLRELVRDMCKAFIHGPCYRLCEHMPEPCNGDKCQYVRRMHELGVDA